MSVPDEVAFVRAAQAGDPAGLGALLVQHRARLHAVAASMLGHGPQVEDAVHDTFLVALGSIGSLRDPAAARPWLLSIIRNVCRMQLRRPAELVTDPAELPPVPSGAVEDSIEQAVLRDWVWAALERLPESQRLVTVLRYFTRASTYDAIAEVCGIPIGTVRSRLNAARLKPVSYTHLTLPTILRV